MPLNKKSKVFKKKRVVKKKPVKKPAVMKLKNATKMLEQKYCPINRVSEQAPVAIALGAQTYQNTIVLGNSIPPNWTGSFNLIGGLAIAQGDGINSRDGNMVYLQNTRMHMLLDMQSSSPMSGSSGIRQPILFRMLVYKAKLKYLAGGTSNPGESLFLNEVDAAVGPQTTGITGNDIMTFKTNRRNFTILKDQRFTLSPHTISAVNINPDASTVPGGSNTIYYSHQTGPYPTSKEIVLTLPHNKKVHYDTANNPDNYNGAWCVQIFARCQGQDDYASQWELNMRASTKFKDI